MAPHQKKQRLQDKSHTFLVPSDVVHSSSSSVKPIAVVDKVSADYRRTLPQEHRMRPPTPPLQSFFDSFHGFDDEEGDVGPSTSTQPGTSTQPVITNFLMDPIVERRKHYTNSVSKVTLFH